MKKLLSLALALVMALSLLPATALAADTLPITWLPDGMQPMTYLEKTGRILAKQGTNWYWLDTSGNIVSSLGETGYDAAYDFTDGLALASKGEYPDTKYGFIDETGKVVIPLVYDFANGFSDGLASIQIGKYPNNKHGFINTAGQTVVAPTYESAGDFSEGLAAVRKDGKWGYINTTGKLVIPTVYDGWGDSFLNGVAVVRLGEYPNEKCGLISKTGQLVTDMDYDDMYNYDGELITVMRNGRVGAIDAAGKQIIPYQNLKDGMAEADTGHGIISEGFLELYTEDYQTIYIDKTGKQLGPYDFGTGFNNGLAYVAQNGRSGFIDTTGNIAFYLDIPAGKEIVVSGFYGPYGGERLTIVAAATENYWNIDSEEEPLFGAVDRSGKIVLPYEYDYIAVPDGPVGWVRKGGYDNGKYGLFAVPGYQPEQPTQPATAQANPTNDKLTVNGVEQNPTVYKIGDSNYFKIRDLAAVLNGTGKQFSVGYDAEKQSVTAAPGQPYELTGTELAGAAASSQTAQASNDAVYVNGKKVEAEVYKIGGSNYFKLRDLGAALGFEVGWTPEQGMFINTEA